MSIHRNLRYFRFEKNSNFNVSKIRNYGASLAEGNILTFMDCGIAISDNFIANTLKLNMENIADFRKL